MPKPQFIVPKHQSCLQFSDVQIIVLPFLLKGLTKAEVSGRKSAEQDTDAK